MRKPESRPYVGQQEAHDHWMQQELHGQPQVRPSLRALEQLRHLLQARRPSQLQQQLVLPHEQIQLTPVSRLAGLKLALPQPQLRLKQEMLGNSQQSPLLQRQLQLLLLPPPLQVPPR